MKIKVRCPASCGELLQGVIGEGEKLISYPINMYSTVTLEEVKKPYRVSYKPKALSALSETIKYLGYHPSILNNVEMRIDSEIPIAKGMAGSTADVAAASMAMATLLGKPLREDELARICVAVEPTDSTIFKELTLFDHLKGKKSESFSWEPKLDILILESNEVLDTIEFRKNNFEEQKSKNKYEVEEALQLVRKADRDRCPHLLGKAATKSALVNQNIIPKKNLEEIVEICSSQGCYGVNVAHSGTVIGIIFSIKRVDPELLIRQLRNKQILVDYPHLHFRKMVEGGTEILYK